MLEPWCDKIKMDLDDDIINKYIEKEQVDTDFDLRSRINVNTNSDIESTL